MPIVIASLVLLLSGNRVASHPKSAVEVVPNQAFVSEGDTAFFFLLGTGIVDPVRIILRSPVRLLDTFLVDSHLSTGIWLSIPRKAAHEEVLALIVSDSMGVPIAANSVNLRATENQPSFFRSQALSAAFGLVVFLLGVFAQAIGAWYRRFSVARRYAADITASALGALHTAWGKKRRPVAEQHLAVLNQAPPVDIGRMRSDRIRSVWDNLTTVAENAPEADSPEYIWEEWHNKVLSIEKKIQAHPPWKLLPW